MRPLVSGMEISSSRGLKKTLKLAPGLIFGGFFNPWEEEISIPETQPIWKSYIYAPSTLGQSARKPV